MAQVRSSIADNFSITRGGPLHLLAARLGLAGDERRLVLRRALVVILIAWLPLHSGFRYKRASLDCCADPDSG